MIKEYQALISDETKVNAILANTSAYLNENINQLNWVGFYVNEDNALHLHAFQGKVACTVIDFNRGVCGYAARNKKVTNVPNVHEFDDHIACDSASESELVVPIIVNNELFGVLDIDSPILNRFDKELETTIVEIVKVLENKLTQLFSK
ncbi:GAF domain-containing protein [Mycoplasma nasistruthionis]|uniref:GAF domain-containing protein n=1 Tax=Mycoplasma nasistruthionis TaxID=353852 RepID=A0A4Y6I772_9MOLU|nr:GAF domain-containing protein [Mycoplasma nasistruthionis]QDF65170.1 GAF domain-containing protein [Mycoplasma nasistruthionis]